MGQQTSRLASAGLWASLCALVAAVSIQRIRAFDYWWHLRTGRLIAETGSVPRTDPYTFTVPGADWIDIHWLHQLALHALHALGGHTAVVLGKLALVAMLVAVLATIGYRRERPVVSVVPLALMLLVAADRFMPRPELPTFVCLAAVLALLDRFLRRGDAWVYAIVAVQLLWVNVHGLFALGIAVCAITLAGEVLRPIVAPGERIRVATVRRLAVVTLLAALVSLVNPNGVDGALYPIQQLQMIGPPEERGVFGSMISELLPPIGGIASMKALPLSLVLSLAGAGLLAMGANWRRVHAADPLLFVAFLYLALGAQRNVALFAIVAAAICVRNANEFLDARAAAKSAGDGQPARGWIAVALRGLVALLVLGAAADVARGRFFERVGSGREPGFGLMDVFYPIGAADWIARERPPGPISHHMADGGYLIWRLYPDYEVMTDGRLEVFGPDRFLELQVPGPERFRELDAEYGFGTVLVHYSLVRSDALLWWLYLNSNWQLVFVDDVAAVFTRIPARGGSPWPEVDVDAPDLFEPLPDEHGTRDLARRAARVQFYAALQRNEVALARFEETLERYPDFPRGRLLHASLLRRNGFSAAAEAVLRKLLEERPHDVRLHTEIGDLRLASGDLEGARERYDEALTLSPGDLVALQRRGRLYEEEGNPQAAMQLYVRVLARAHPADPVGALTMVRVRTLQTTVPGL